MYEGSSRLKLLFTSKVVYLMTENYNPDSIDIYTGKYDVFGEPEVIIARRETTLGDISVYKLDTKLDCSKEEMNPTINVRSDSPRKLSVHAICESDLDNSDN